MTWREKIRSIALEHLYRVRRKRPGCVPALPHVLPPHPIWQSPFVLASPDENWEALKERVACAGDLWLINRDFLPYHELIISHIERPWFMAFQRAERPDEGHLVIGPLARRVMKPTDGEPLWGLPLRYRQTETPTARDLWRRVASDAPGISPHPTLRASDIQGHVAAGGESGRQ